MLHKKVVINLYDCKGHEQTMEELKFLVKSLHPYRRELPELNEHMGSYDYYTQLVAENYLDMFVRRRHFKVFSESIHK